MTAFLIISAFLLYTFQAFADKLSSKITYGKKSVMLFGVIKCGFGATFALLFLIISGGNFSLYKHTLWVSVLAGVGQGVCTFLIIEALKRSTLIQVNMFMSAGVLFPTVFSAVFFGETLDALKIVAIFLFLIASALLLGVKSVKDFAVNRYTFILLFALSLFYGVIMFSQKAYPKLVPDGNVALFSFLMYSTSTVLLFFGFLFSKKNESETEKTFMEIADKKFILIGILCAAIVFSLNQTITMLSGLLPAAFTFPLTNGAKLAIVAIVAALAFKEKPKAGVILGMIIMVGAIYMLSV